MSRQAVPSSRSLVPAVALSPVSLASCLRAVVLTPSIRGLVRPCRPWPSPVSLTSCLLAEVVLLCAAEVLAHGVRRLLLPLAAVAPRSRRIARVSRLKSAPSAVNVRAHGVAAAFPRALLPAPTLSPVSLGLRDVVALIRAAAIVAHAQPKRNSSWCGARHPVLCRRRAPSPLPSTDVPRFFMPCGASAVPRPADRCASPAM